MLSWVSSLANSNADSNSRCCFYICRCRDANVQCLYRAVGKWSCCLTAQSQTERVELMCLCVVSVNVNVTSSWTHHVLREPFWSGRGVFLCPCVCVCFPDLAVLYLWGPFVENTPLSWGRLYSWGHFADLDPDLISTSGGWSKGDYRRKQTYYRSPLSQDGFRVSVRPRIEISNCMYL